MQNKYKYLIGNEWRDSKDVLEVRNPYNNEIVSTTFLATEKDVNDAIQAAVHAFEETRKLPSFKRAEILGNIRDGIQERSEEFAQMIALEAGKPITDARTEVERAIGTFQIAVEESKRMLGEYIPLDISGRSKNRTAINKRFPIGPILGISPFNFPLNLVVHKAPIAQKKRHYDARFHLAVTGLHCCECTIQSLETLPTYLVVLLQTLVVWFA